MKCQITRIPVQHYRHADVFWIIRLTLCVFLYYADVFTMFCNVESNNSTFLLLDDDLLKYLMICYNFLHLLWILIETYTLSALLVLN